MTDELSIDALTCQTNLQRLPTNAVLYFSLDLKVKQSKCSELSQYLSKNRRKGSVITGPEKGELNFLAQPFELLR